MNIARPPRPELRKVAGLLDEAVEAYAAARTGIEVEGGWEAPLEAFALSGLCVRNVEAVAVLAKTDEVLAPAAWANARNAFEIAVRVIWLLYPDDRFEAEMRWIALLQEYERFHTRMTNVPETAVDSGRRHLDLANRIREFRLGVEERIPPGYAPPSRIPSVEQMLKEINTPAMYAIYIEGSQFLHGTMAASAAYRRGLGVAKELGDFSTIVHWIPLLRASWLSIKNAGSFVVDRLSGSRYTLDWTPIGGEIDAAFRALALTVDDG